MNNIASNILFLIAFLLLAYPFIAILILHLTHKRKIITKVESIEGKLLSIEQYRDFFDERQLPPWGRTWRRTWNISIIYRFEYIIKDKTCVGWLRHGLFRSEWSMDNRD